MNQVKALEMVVVGAEPVIVAGAMVGAGWAAVDQFDVVGHEKYVHVVRRRESCGQGFVSSMTRTRIVL